MDVLDTLKKPGYTTHLGVKGRGLSHIYNPVLNANLYVSMSGIVAALHASADIFISGRYCDISIVMGSSRRQIYCSVSFDLCLLSTSHVDLNNLGAAAWWHGWEDEHDKLAGALITACKRQPQSPSVILPARVTFKQMDKTGKGDFLVDGIECGFYMTGGNFSGFNSIYKTGTRDFLSLRSRLTVHSWLPYKKGHVN
jgi:hypothetical protein